MRGVFLDRDTMKPDDLDFSAFDAVIAQWDSYPWSQPHEVAQRIAPCDIVVVNKTLIGERDMAAAPKLKLICITATGTNNVDLAAAAKRGIVVCNVSGYAQGAVVQHTFALMLALVTNWHRYQKAAYDGTWSKSPMFCLLDYPVTELAGKTLGIVGLGSLGQKVADVAHAFDMEVIVASGPWRTQPDPQHVPWDEFIRRVDILSVHCPLSEHTRNLINAKTLRAMKTTAFVINTARGGIVNEEDLIAALRNGDIAGAALDVLTQEPPPADHPVLRAQLPNLLLTPHAAWVSTEARQRLLDGTTANIRAFLARKPTNVVNGVTLS